MYSELFVLSRCMGILSNLCVSWQCEESLRKGNWEAWHCICSMRSVSQRQYFQQLRKVLNDCKFLQDCFCFAFRTLIKVDHLSSVSLLPRRCTLSFFLANLSTRLPIHVMYIEFFVPFWYTLEKFVRVMTKQRKFDERELICSPAICSMRSVSQMQYF